MFISKAFRRAEVILEQFDEKIAQASRQLVVEGATGAVDEHEEIPSDEEQSQTSRASTIPRAEHRAGISAEEESPIDLDGPIGGAWTDDIVIDEAMLTSAPLQESKASSQEEEQATVLEDSGTEGSVTAEQPTSRVQKSAEPHTEETTVANPHVPITTQMEKNLQTKAPMPPGLPRSSSMQSGSFVVAQESDEYINALKAETKELRKELEIVEGELEKYRREKSKLVKNLKRMKDIVKDMDESLREKSAEARSLEEELVSARDKVASLEAKSRESDARGKDGIDNLRKELSSEIESLQEQLDNAIDDNEALQEENERLKEALVHGHEVEAATADGARQEATQAHRAYEAETLAHRETREKAKAREETLEAEAALATTALASAQRKVDESAKTTSDAKSAQRAAEAKLAAVTSARDAAFARIADLQEALRLYETGEDNEAPGQKEAKAMTQTVSEFENALEAKNVELNRLEGELEALRASFKSPRHSPRSPGPPGRAESTTPLEVEIKLRHMADAALRKQAQLEVLRSENRALQHQLTTERKRTREAQAMAAAASSSRQSIRGGFRGILEAGEDERGERIYGVRDGPLARFRTPRSWPRPISKVLTGMDKFSAQALAFLRKEPLLRIVILVYVFAMHIFVYSLLHWHIGTVSGSADSPHPSIASAKSGGQGRGPA